MQSKGIIKEISKCFDDKNYNYKITLLTKNIKDIELLSGEIEVALTRPEDCKIRSLQANKYFHELVGSIAEELEVSKAYAKNTMLAKYGQRMMDDDGPIRMVVLSNVDMMEKEDIHTVAVGYDFMEKDGEYAEYTIYEVLGPSHTYTRKQMHHLISGTEQDAKELGISTLDEEYINEICKRWSPK